MGTWMRQRNEPDGQFVERWHYLARLAASIRADDPRETVMERVSAALPAITGFQSIAFYAACPETGQITLVSGVGMTPADRKRLLAVTLSPEQVAAWLLPDSAYLPERLYRLRPAHLHLVADITRERLTSQNGRGDKDAWTPLDTLLIPLRHTTTGEILGLIALDDPADPRSLQDQRQPGTLEILKDLADVIVMAFENLLAYNGAGHSNQQIHESVAALAQHISQARNGDFTHTLAESGSPLDSIVDLFDEMLAQLSTALWQIRSASETVHEQSDALANLASRVMSGMQIQARHIGLASTTIATIAESLADIGRISDAAGIIVANARDFSQVGRESVAEAVGEMNGMREASLQSSQRVKRLAESLQEIETIVQHVSDFTNKTNLLAVNAAIEAAHADKFGRGFAVIAQEIRTLALNSADAAKQISSRIKAVQGEASVAVTAIAEGTERVVEQSERIVDAGTTLMAIDDVTENLAQINDELRLATQQETERTATLVSSMNDIMQITEATAGGVRQIASSMGQLVDVVTSLRESLHRFTLRDDPSGARRDF
jgi:methyl-accepting chemotaxis protein